MDDGKANAYGPDMIAALDESFTAAEEDAKAIVLSGRDSIFSAGFNLKVMQQGGDAAMEMVRAGIKFFVRLYGHSQPVVAACTGHAIAGGAILLLGCDYRIGAKGKAQIGLNETSIGMALPPFAIEIARGRIPAMAQTEALLGAKLYDPEGATQAGFLEEAVAAEDVFETALAKAAHYSTLDLKAYATTKRNLRQGAIDIILPTIEDGLG